MIMLVSNYQVIRMDKKDINLLGLVAFVGAIIMIVGVFLAWGKFEVTTYIGGTSESYTGWQIFNDMKDNLDYYYAPVVALACGIVALLAMILPTINSSSKMDKINKILSIVVLIVSIVSIVFMVQFYSSFTDATDLGGIIGAKTTVQIGFWLCLVGGIITAIGGILPIVKKITA